MKTTTVPVLTDIKVSAHLSDETPAFTAVLLYNGGRYMVQNDGRGGCNNYPMGIPSRVLEELESWAAEALPPITECGGCILPNPIPMDFETWTFEQAFNLIEA